MHAQSDYIINRSTAYVAHPGFLLLFCSQSRKCDNEHSTLDETRPCLSVCLSVPRKRFLGTVEVIIIKLGMVAAAYMPMHDVLITMTLTFIQGQMLIIKKKMFDYFRTCSSNGHHISCAASPTKGLYHL